jgi:F-type H+-transporting ATPase subunit b
MLDFNIPTFLFSVINLIVIYLILKKVLFVPVMNFMEKRRLGIIESMEKARIREETADGKIREYDTLIEQEGKKAEDIYKEAVEKGRNEYASIIDAAERDADKIRNDGREEIAKEREALYREFRGKVAELSVVIASKLMKENMDTEKNSILVNSFLSDEDTMR